MKDSKQMAEQELDQVVRGGACEFRNVMLYGNRIVAYSGSGRVLIRQQKILGSLPEEDGG